MSGLAIVARALGATVTGSDRAESPYLIRVRESGIEPVIGHAAANVPAGDDVELVVSVSKDASNWPDCSQSRRNSYFSTSPMTLPSFIARVVSPVTLILPWKNSGAT